MAEEKYLHSELTGRIIGCAMEVHKALGNGFQEVIYQRALDIEMAQQGLSASREHEMDIFYKGIKIGNRPARGRCPTRGRCRCGSPTRG
jgi:hypothetical protein